MWRGPPPNNSRAIHRAGGRCSWWVLGEQMALAGLAGGGGRAWPWGVLARSPAPPAAAAGYRPAGSALPASVARRLDELIAGEPLDAAGETGARARGWKP